MFRQPQWISANSFICKLIIHHSFVICGMVSSQAAYDHPLVSYTSKSRDHRSVSRAFASDIYIYTSEIVLLISGGSINHFISVLVLYILRKVASLYTYALGDRVSSQKRVRRDRFLLKNISIWLRDDEVQVL